MFHRGRVHTGQVKKRVKVAALVRALVKRLTACKPKPAAKQRRPAAKKSQVAPVVSNPLKSLDAARTRLRAPPAAAKPNKVPGAALRTPAPPAAARKPSATSVHRQTHPTKGQRKTGFLLRRFGISSKSATKSYVGIPHLRRHTRHGRHKL
ncbi:hypothetical protein DIPPA_08568 [Diplonema papillatum]|nr:hypothetical protein DIPPA_08568 [Diplonema papillatum]